MTVATHSSPKVKPSERLARYVDSYGATRNLILLLGAHGSLLVVDCEARTSTDRRLVAHLGADEPSENAALICETYLQDPSGRWCRRLRPEDLEIAPTCELPQASIELDGDDRALQEALTDARGHEYGLELVWGEMSIPQLRWQTSAGEGAARHALSVREVVGSLERYEPVIDLTARAIARHREDPSVSVVVLGAEFDRMCTTRIVLNRALREKVLAAIAREGLSMSEIAMRCGRIKRDARGVSSGETSWLGRRLGLLPEGGADSPTPWVHSDVLALIARTGLGVSPREVELG